MHPRIFKEFERICARRRAAGRVLEIGAVPSDDTLLCLKALKSADSRTGINLDEPCTFSDFEILQMNANRMDAFEDNSFDTVLCNSTLEHDPFFWKSLAEIRRVLRPGGLLIIGVPGLTEHPRNRPQNLCRDSSFFGNIFRARSEALAASTTTLQVHNFPGDYYRFTPQAVREVFFAQMNKVELISLLVPPRIIGSGLNR